MVPVLERIAERAEGWAKILVAVTVFAVTVAFVVLLHKRLDSHSFKIRPLTVPDSLVEAGIDGRQLAALVRERLHEMQRAKLNLVPGQSLPGIPTAAEPIDFELPGAGITLGELEDLAVELGFPRHTVSSVLASDGKTWTVWLKVDSHPVRVRTLPLEGYDLSAVVPSLVEALARDTLEALDPLQLASYLYSKQEPTACEAVLRRCLLDDNPRNDPYAYNIWGLLLVSQKEFTEAEKKFARASPLASGNRPLRAKIFNNLGLVDLERKAYDAAREDFDAALEIDPDYAIASYNMGNSWLRDAEQSDGASRREKLWKADHAYRRATESDPDLTDAEMNRLVTLAHLGESSHAFDRFEDLDARRWTRDPDFYANWGQLLQNGQAYADAVDKFERALELSPTHPGANEGLAFSRNELGDAEGVLQVYLSWASALLEEGKCEEATRWLGFASLRIPWADPKQVDIATLAETARALQAQRKASCPAIAGP